MKYTRTVPITAALGCVFTLVIPCTYAQSEVAEPTTVQGTADPAQVTTQQSSSARPTKDPTGRQSLPVAVYPDQVLLSELEMMIVPKIELKNVNSQAALLRVLESLEVGYEFDNAFYVNAPVNQAIDPLGGRGLGSLNDPNAAQTLDLPPRNITMRILNAPLPKALDSLTNAIGIGWLPEKRGGSITIRFVKLRNTVTYSDLVNRLTVSNGQNTVYSGMAPATTVYSGVAGNYSQSGGRYMNASSLPPTLVKIDVRDKPVREALRTVLEEAKLEFAIDEDVPADLKKTFAFEGISIGTALSVICQSAGIGWRNEQTPNGSLVRISKRYAPPPPAQKVDKAPESTNPIQ
jgi:hypothetical protein